MIFRTNKLPTQKYNDKVLTTVEQYMVDFPKSRLIDIYKSFFQDEWGPTHLLRDVQKAQSCFEYELMNMSVNPHPCNYNCGLGLNFYRADMSYIRLNLVDKSTFFEAFKTSSQSYAEPSRETWIMKWEYIAGIIAKIAHLIDNFDNDCQAIKQTMSRGACVMHHSRNFIEAYKPHYRIFRKNINFEKLMK